MSQKPKGFVVSPVVLAVIATSVALLACDGSAGVPSGDVLAAVPEPAPGNTIPTSTLRIPLTVSNPDAADRNLEVITSGVPIPRAWNALDSSRFVLLDESGQVVTAQFGVTGRWAASPDAADAPIRWILVSFEASVKAGSSLSFTVVYDDVSHILPSIKILSDDESGVEIDTGTALFELSRRSFSLLEAVVINGRPVLAPGSTRLELIDAKGQRWVGVEDAPSRLEVLETGPIRAVAKLEGVLTSPSGEETLDVTTLLTFYAGQNDVKLLLTVGNHARAALTEGGDSYDVFFYQGKNSLTFEELSLVLQRESPVSPALATWPSSSSIETRELADLVVYQDSSGTDYWSRYANPANNPRLNSYVTHRGYTLTNGSALLEDGDHFPGWLDISDSEAGLTIGVHDFWQSFPKSLEAHADGQVVVGLFPRQFAAPFNFRVGEEKTTEVVLSFHDGQRDAALVASRARSLLSPMMALASPEWYVNSGAVHPFVAAEGSLEERNGQHAATDDNLRRDYYADRTLLADPTYTATDYYYPFHSLWTSSQGHPSSTDYFDIYGWSWYGNQPLEQESTGDGMSGPYNSKYNLDFGAWIQYLRTGDERWRQMAEATSRHIEALMLHDVETETGWGISRWKNAIFGHSQHCEPGNGNSVRNQLGPVLDTAFGARGALLHYYLTGYEPSRRFVEKAADYGLKFCQEVGGCTTSSFAPSREAANLFNILIEGWHLTGNRDYQRLMHDIMVATAPEDKAYINGPIPESTEVVATWIFGQYYDALGRYALLVEEAGLTEERDFAIAQLSRYLEWHLTYASQAPKGWFTIYFTYAVNGNNDPNTENMINNWTHQFADACGYVYGMTRDQRFLDWGNALYHTGAQNPFFIGCPLIFSGAKESVNALVFGHVLQYFASGGGKIPVTGPGPSYTPDESTPPPDNGNNDSSPTPAPSTAAQPPLAHPIVQTPAPHRPGDLLTFASTTSDEAATYHWDFGDGAAAEGLTSTHRFASSGKYPVTLTVTRGTSSSEAHLIVNVHEAGQRFEVRTGLRDTQIRATLEGNYGSSPTLFTYNGITPDYRLLFSIDLDQLSLPAEARILGAYLTLNVKSGDGVENQVVPVSRTWLEGTGVYGNTTDGATWATFDGLSAWTTPGGDLDQSSDYGRGPSGVVDARLAVPGSAAVFDITPLLEDWLSGRRANAGLALTIPAWEAYQRTEFYARESGDASLCPVVVLEVQP